MKDHTPGIEEYFNVSDLRKYLYTYASNYCNNRDDLEDMGSPAKVGGDYIKILSSHS